MKKSSIALALVLAVGIGLSAVEAFAWCGGTGGYGRGQGYHMGAGYHRGGGYHMGGNFAGAQNSKEFQKFLDETKDLRAELAADRGEYRALMSGQNPDPARGRELSERIFAKRAQLAEKARALNITTGCGYGAGYGPGVACDGTGPGPRRGWRR